MAKKFNKTKFKNMLPSEIGKLKTPQLRQLLQGARQLFQAQSEKFGKYDNRVYSYSHQKMLDYYQEHGREKVTYDKGIEIYQTVPENMSHMTLNEMRGELFRLQEFFNAKTSTVPGARKVQSDTAKRIFGEDSRGRAKNNLNVDEWRQFWDIYEEYANQRPSDILEQSNIVQQMLGEIVLESLNLGHMSQFGQAVLDELRERVEARENKSFENKNVKDGYGDPVYTGTRPY